MSMNPQVPAFAPSKTGTSSSSSVFSSTIPNPIFGGDAQRRGVDDGGGVGCSPGEADRSALASPRNNQPARRAHRNHRKPNTPRIDTEEQVAMMSPTGRKGTSITHLINWDAAIPRPHAFHEYRPRNFRRNPTWGLGSGYHAVDKARYVNANFRFVVNPCGDYRAQTVDPDVHLPWDHILQILASAQSQCLNCPICLSEPVAPRMTKCGHIFCLPCLIRYMASIDDGNMVVEKRTRYKKCVICTDSVYMDDIRPVRFWMGQESGTPREGGDVVLRLIRRAQGSTVALPRDSADPLQKLEDIPWHFAAEVMDYARIMRGTEDYMTEQFEKEIKELNMMEKEDELMFGEDGNWSRKAVAMIHTQIKGIKGMRNPPQPLPGPKKAKEEKRPVIKFKDSHDIRDMYHIHHEARSGHLPALSYSHTETSTVGTEAAYEARTSSQPFGTVINSISKSLARAPIQSALSEPSRDDSYYFYRALPHFYLSSLDIRILKAEFGSYCALPSTTSPRVENLITGHFVDDDLRKRAKYLAHLPYGYEVGFLECDWTDIVPPTTLAKFKDEIEKRRKRKKDKETKEERDRIKAERKDDEERWAAARLRRTTRPLQEEFLEEDFVALTALESASTAIGDGTSFSAPGALPSSLSTQSGPVSLAFSKTSPVQNRTVWGTPAIQQYPGPSPRPRPAEDYSGWLPDWEKDLLLEEEILARMEAEDTLPGSGPGGCAPIHGNGQKKKKMKKVTLMTNGGRRGL